MLRMVFGLLAAACLTTTGYANETTGFEPFTGKVVGTKVRVRTAPSLDSHVVRETGYGELFAVLEKKDGFYGVEPPQSTKGYLFRTFVLDGVVEGSHVNVRLYPDMEAPVIAQFNTGDRVKTTVSDVNNKWLEVELPATARFYIAEEFFEKIGPLEMLAQVKARHQEASHQLASACMYAQSEIQKRLPQIDLDGITSRFEKISTTYSDLPEIVQSAEEASHLIGEVYIQKKIAFLESETGQSMASYQLNPTHVERLAKLGITLRSQNHEVADAAACAMGLTTTLGAQEITDKMLVWEPIERSLHHLWAAAHPGASMEEFYADQQETAITLSGMIESYNRPVKNLPGDYLLRIDNHPVAFLYSTKINLEKLVGRQVTVVGAPRSNNHFAFPAYFVLSID